MKTHAHKAHIGGRRGEKINMVLLFLNPSLNFSVFLNKCATLYNLNAIL
jgi:hypothetical protein